MTSEVMKGKDIRFEKEIPFGESGKSYLLTSMDTLVFWDGKAAKKRYHLPWDFYPQGASRDGRRIFGGAAKATLRCINIRDSSVAWKQRVPFWTYTISSMTNIGDAIYTGGQNGIFAAEDRTGHVLWSYPYDTWFYSIPVVEKDVLYWNSDSGGICAFGAQTGRLLWRIQDAEYYPQVHWRKSIPAVSDRDVYYLRRDGFLYSVENIAK
jgi:outer membrane protein assembly factor BamB